MMTFRHKLVSEALTEEKRWTSSWAEADQSESIKILKSNIASSVRGMQFIMRDRASLYMYIEGNPYCLGWVSAGQKPEPFDGEQSRWSTEYTVSSPNIVNNRYSDYNDEHYTKTTGSCATALRHIKRYMRPYSPRDMLMVTFSDVVSKVTSVAFTARQDLRASVETMFNISSYTPDSPLLTELRHLVKAGHTFLSPAFSADLAKYFELKDNSSALSGREVPMWFVRVYECMGAQKFETVYIANATSAYTSTSNTVDRYEADNLPDHIMGKLSVLNMLADGEYVDGVGYRAGEGMFYVVD